MISFNSSISFSNSEKRLKKLATTNVETILHKYGEIGVNALSKNTPQDTGETAISWGYEVVKTPKGYTLQWFNTNIVDGANVAILLQYGHATRSGTFIQGIDYINPTMKPIFQNIRDSINKEVQ